MEKENEDKNKKRKEVERALAKYSTMTFKMAGIIIAGFYFGDWLDVKFKQEEFPTFTLIFSLLSVFLSTYSMIRDLTKK